MDSDASGADASSNHGMMSPPPSEPVDAVAVLASAADVARSHDAPVEDAPQEDAPKHDAVDNEEPVAAASLAAETVVGETPAPAPGGMRSLGVDPAAVERKRRAQEHWERAVAAHASGVVLEGTVTASVKGGLLVDVDGVRGFLPASQASPGAGVGIETLVKQKLPLKIIDVDAVRKRVVVSHRRAAESQKRAARTTLLKSLQVGQRFVVTVVRLTDFGAFVDIGSGIDGLVPMSELAFERVEKVGDLLAIGDTFEAVVIRIDEGGRKIALSRKNALPDPWRDHADIVRVGATVEGKVVGKEPRLQVEIAPGVVGAVRESDADPAEYEIGEAIEVSIRNLDRRTRRITLTTLHGAAAAIVSKNTPGSGFATLGEELMSRMKKR
jgi:ribosomal protein S1